MRKLFDASEWTCVVPEAPGKSFLMEVPLRANVELEVRCSGGVVVNGITSDGTTLFLGSGTQVEVSARLVGFVAVELVTGAGAFAYKSVNRDKWREIPDQTPCQVTAVIETDPVRAAMREEMRRYLLKLEADKLLADDVSAEELWEDFEHGDLEFDEEPEMFGSGHEEQELAADGPGSSKDAPGSASSPGEQSSVPAALQASTEEPGGAGTATPKVTQPERKGASRTEGGSLL